MLFIDGDHILSQEGTTQGDPLAMAMYAIGTLPLICKLHGDVTQVWYADDASAGGKTSDLRVWWDSLVSYGSHFGYNPTHARHGWLSSPSIYPQQKNTSEALESTSLSRDIDTSVPL